MSALCRLQLIFVIRDGCNFVRILRVDIFGLEDGTVAQTKDYERARARAEANYGFFVHAVVFVAVMVLLVIINLLTSSGTLWFIWPLLGWGLAVALHGAGVFLLGGRNTILDAMTEHELRKSGTDKRDEST